MMIVLLVFFNANLFFAMDNGYDADDEYGKKSLSDLISKESTYTARHVDHHDNQRIKKEPNIKEDPIKKIERSYIIAKQKQASLVKDKANFFFEKLDQNIKFIANIINNYGDPYTSYERFHYNYTLLSRIYGHLNLLLLKNRHNKCIDKSIALTVNKYWDYYDTVVEKYYAYSSIYNEIEK